MLDEYYRVSGEAASLSVAHQHILSEVLVATTQERIDALYAEAFRLMCLLAHLEARRRVLWDRGE